ncbi:MAG: acyltransferase [Bacillota bacterium]|nr:acyltransferase [Bacillota bacterium]
MKKIGYYVCLMLYYMIARHLPGSDLPYGFGSKKIRRFLCKRIFLSAGKNLNVEHGSFFGSGRDIEIGDNTGLGINCRIMGPLKIGSEVMMGPEVMIFTQNHENSRLDIPMNRQTAPKRPVVIEDDVWIAARVIILPGITVHKGAILGAGAVITKDVPEYAVVGGNPARIIKFRNGNEIKNEKTGDK